MENIRELFAKFEHTSELLELEGEPVDRIARAFAKYVEQKVMQHKARQRKSALKLAAVLNI